MWQVCRAAGQRRRIQRRKHTRHHGTRLLRTELRHGGRHLYDDGLQHEHDAPGIIDHKEWTPANGRNNALRINGLGAPRAFYTPVLREVKVPNTSYGEDYALGLNFSRQYQIGRVYDVVYLCRRWDDNSDASLDIVKMNGHNLYKDRIRTWELQARIAMNKNK